MSTFAGKLVQVAGGVLAAMILAGAAAGITWLSTRSAPPLTAGAASSPTTLAAGPTSSAAPTDVAALPPSEPPARPSPDPPPAATVGPDPTPVRTLPPLPTPPPPATPGPAPTSTPEPVPDPSPEGTTRVFSASGTFGQTLTVEGVTVHLEPVPALSKDHLCQPDDPERQGWTEVVSFGRRVDWPDRTLADWPGLWVGEHPWHLLDFEGPDPFESGVEYIVTTCKRPADSMQVTVELGPPGSPLTIYSLRFE